MAPKQQSPPPSDSSSDDEELSETNLQTPPPKQSQNSNSSDSEQDESSSEEDNENPSVKKSDSGSDTDDDSGSDTDSTASRLNTEKKTSSLSIGVSDTNSTLKVAAGKPSKPAHVPNASPSKSLQNKAKITASGDGKEKKTFALLAGVSGDEKKNPSVEKSDSGSDTDDDSGSDTDSTESRLKADLVKPSKQAQGKEHYKGKSTASGAGEEKKTSTLSVPNASPLKSLQNKAKITASGDGEEKKTLALLAGVSGDDDSGSDTDSVPEVDVVKPSKHVPNASSSKSLQNKGKTPAGGGGLFVRVFGDDDEVAVLEGMDEFRKKTERDPGVDKDAFFEFMKKMLKIDVTKAQLMDKVRRLKKKYLNHANKGDDHVISKPHELKLYELSKKVWAGHGAMKRKTAEGADDLASEGVKSRKKAKSNLRLAKKNGDPEGVWDDYPYFREALEVENSGYFLKKLVDLNEIGPVKAKEMDDEWREFHAKEMELKLLRLKLEKKQTKLVLDSQKP